jgi:hypothetical protein
MQSSRLKYAVPSTEPTLHIKKQRRPVGEAPTDAKIIFLRRANYYANHAGEEKI